MSPADVDESTLWEFTMAMDGWKRVHAPEDTAPAMSVDMARDLGIEGF